MSLFAKGNTVNLVHLEGLPGYGSAEAALAITMTFDEENRCLVFKARLGKQPEIKLSLSKVISAGKEYVTKTKQKSKTGRAVAGGLLFGSAGAMVGAMTAGEKKRIECLYVIKYESDEGVKSIVLRDFGGNFNFPKLQKKLQEYLPKQEVKEQPKEITL